MFSGVNCAGLIETDEIDMRPVLAPRRFPALIASASLKHGQLVLDGHPAHRFPALIAPASLKPYDAQQNELWDEEVFRR